jgi:putative peptide zinc metalloprotease protein
MAEPLFSASWYRVAGVRPRLRPHARVHRHKYRGHTWFVLQDLSTGRFHRFRPAAYRVIGLMNGERTVDEIWHHACELLGDDSPTQDEMIRLLAQLHQSDVLQSDVPPDTAELLWRRETQRRSTWTRKLMSPFAVQIPLLDPERFLQRTVHLVRPLVGWAGLVVWAVVVLPALVLAALRWPELTEGGLDSILTPRNLVLLWLLFPVIKTLHELGHAYVTRALGGEVHEVGIMLLVFTPVPYVDASSASAFPRGLHRVAVGAAGMLVEVFIAALAMIVWANAEPGVVRALAFNLMLIAGVTTLLFNANPLLRFDGYYMLADWLEIPNLRQRSNAYVGYLLERWVLRRREARAPEASEGERFWLLSYAVASFVYRVLIIVAIATLVLDWSLVLGTLLLGFAAIGWLVMPAVKGVRFLLQSPRLREVRGRAIGAATGAAAGVVLLLTLAPFPLRTHAEGVVWIPEEAYVRAAEDGFVERVIPTPGESVRRGDPLVECSQPELEAQAKELEARVRELEAMYAERRADEPAGAQLVMEELRYARQSLARADERLRAELVRSETSGIFVSPRAADLPGRFVQKGELLAQVIDLDGVTVRAVVAQDDIDLIRARLEGVRVRLAQDLARVIPAQLRRVVPQASQQLPSTALGTEGGGEVIVDPRQAGGASALESMFEVELALEEQARAVNAGGRVYVRFDLGSEPLLGQWLRRLRQLFLRRFSV